MISTSHAMKFDPFLISLSYKMKESDLHMKNNEKIVYGKRIKRSDIVISIFSIWVLTFLFLKLVFIYVKTNGYVDGFINESFFEPTLALILTPIIVLLALSVTKLQYLELNDDSIIYYRGNSLMESLKMVAEILKSGDYKNAYQEMTYSTIKKLRITYNSGNPISKANFDTYYLSLKLFDNKECFFELTQSMLLNDKLDMKLIAQIIEKAKEHLVRVDDPYQIVPLLRKNPKFLYRHLTNVSNARSKKCEEKGSL